MKNLVRTIVFALGAGVCALSLARATDETTPPPAAPNGDHSPGDGPEGKWGERAQKRQQHLIKALGLSADQQSKWTALNQQEKADAKAVWADPSIPKDQKKEKLQAIRKDYEGQRKAILTPEQQKKMTELRERHGHHGEDGQTPPPPPPTT